jgi:predicted ABC-type transport system involved in lysophospholipase L1 biosynthesis ATPase subunit
MAPPSPSWARPSPASSPWRSGLRDGHLDRVLIALLALLALASFEAVQPLAAGARELVGDARGRPAGARAHRSRAGGRGPAAPGAGAGVAVRGRARGRARALWPRRAPGARRVQPAPRAGRRVALVGPSGAGKTTVVNLLLRFLDPEAGRVTLAGRDLRDYRQEDVRRAIAVAGQDSHLFSASIRDNVRLARPSAANGDRTGSAHRARLRAPGVPRRDHRRARALRESDTVRVIDALAVHKDADGEIEVEHLSNLSKDEAIELGSKVGALIGLGIEGEEGMEAGAEAGAEAAADGGVTSSPTRTRGTSSRTSRTTPPPR